ncbi:MAG: twin-arginine translocation signal domain-containing protein, partial [Thermoguttaceae bacterium]|nr:twin-arginine translocation signal domain-containing protein [Thermoguttaceae bacterium]
MSSPSKKHNSRKDKTVQRRDFLKTSMALAAAAAMRGVTAQEKPSPRWYKGNIHCHSQWSDG